MACRSIVIAAGLVFAGACKYPALPDLPDTTDADIDAMTCTQTTCEAGVLRVCGTAGTVIDVVSCPLGCFSQTRCAWVDPSNGLGAFLDTTAAQGDVSLPQGAVIDTDTGMVHVGAQMIPVMTDTVNQPGGPTLRVLMASSWTIHDVRVQGGLPLAIIGIGDVQIDGIIDASADANAPGPGASSCGSGTGAGGNQTYGFWTVRRAGHDGTGSHVWCAPGSGGGGFGTAGAKGGDFQPMVGAAAGAMNGTPTLVPLRGGCSGGSNGFAGIAPGAGGGAIQIVSAQGQIVSSATSAAGIHAGGGGGDGCDNNGTSDTAVVLGCGTAGGGSGGGILLEAAHVRVGDSSILVASGGGGGGSGGCGTPRNGQDAPPTAAVASGGACPPEAWGQPPTGGAGASDVSAQPGANATYFTAGSGGGGLGRIRINTMDATFEGQSSATIHGVLTTGTVTTR